MTNGSIDGSFGLRTCSTSAPCSASVRAQVGPASTRVRSRTRTPESGRAPCSSARGPGRGSRSASPRRRISTIGTCASAIPCGCTRHSSALRSFAPHTPRSASASSSACASHDADGLRDRAGVVIAIQKCERAFARTESAMQMDPSPVACSIESGRCQAGAIERRALIAQVQERDERRGRSAHVHFDTLRTAAARAPQVGGCGCIRREHCGGSFAGAKGSCDDGVVSDDLERVLI